MQDSRDNRPIEDVLRSVHEGQTGNRPKLKPGDWITIGNKDAVICTTYADLSQFGPHLEVVYLDDRNRAINEDVAWDGKSWKLPEGIGGGYADKYPRLSEFVSKLRHGRYR